MPFALRLKEVHKVNKVPSTVLYDHIKFHVMHGTRHEPIRLCLISVTIYFTSCFSSYTPTKRNTDPRLRLVWKFINHVHLLPVCHIRSMDGKFVNHSMLDAPIHLSVPCGAIKTLLVKSNMRKETQKERDRERVTTKKPRHKYVVYAVKHKS